MNEGATVPLVAPGNFTLTEPEEGSAVDMVWDPVLVEDNGGSQITHYEYRFKAEGDEEYGSWTTIPDSAEGGAHNALYQIVSLPSTTPPAPLTNGINHLFELRVVNGIGASAPSAEIEGFPATTPTEPVDVAVDADRDESAKVTWGAPDDDGGKPITSYQVQVTHIDDSSSVEIDEDWFTTPSPDYHEFSNLENGIDYTFNVRAVNDVGEGDLGSSNGIPATRPDAPFLSVVSEDDQAVTVGWSAPENDGGRDIDSYELRTNRTGQWVAPSHAADNQHTFTGLTNGLPYTFEVRAINALGEGKPDSISAIPVTVPGAPIGVAANRGNRALHISWGEPSSNGGGDVTGYQLSYGEIANVGETPGTWSGPFSVASTNYSASGLVNGQLYKIEVVALNRKGESAGASLDKEPATKPVAPVLMLVRGGPAEATLSWSVSDLGGLPVTRYEYRPIDNNTGTWVTTGRFDNDAESLTLLPMERLTITR